jgi:hypothetical protein
MKECVEKLAKSGKFEKVKEFLKEKLLRGKNEGKTIRKVVNPNNPEPECETARDIAKYRGIKHDLADYKTPQERQNQMGAEKLSPPIKISPVDYMEITADLQGECGECWMCGELVYYYGGEDYEGEHHVSSCGNCEHVAGIVPAMLAGMLAWQGLIDIMIQGYKPSHIHCNNYKSDHVPIKFDTKTTQWDTDIDSTDDIVNKISPPIEIHKSEYCPYFKEVYTAAQETQSKIKHYRQTAKKNIETTTGVLTKSINSTLRLNQGGTREHKINAWANMISMMLKDYSGEKGSASDYSGKNVSASDDSNKKVSSRREREEREEREREEREERKREEKNEENEKRGERRKEREAKNAAAAAAKLKAEEDAAAAAKLKAEEDAAAAAKLKAEEDAAAEILTEEIDDAAAAILTEELDAVIYAETKTIEDLKTRIKTAEKDPVAAANEEAERIKAEIDAKKQAQIDATNLYANKNRGESLFSKDNDNKNGGDGRITRLEELYNFIGKEDIIHIARYTLDLFEQTDLICKDYKLPFYHGFVIAGFIKKNLYSVDSLKEAAAIEKSTGTPIFQTFFEYLNEIKQPNTKINNYYNTDIMNKSPRYRENSKRNIISRTHGGIINKPKQKNNNTRKKEKETKLHKYTSKKKSNNTSKKKSNNTSKKKSNKNSKKKSNKNSKKKSHKSQ